MAVSLKHNFQSLKADSEDTTIVRPLNWNEEHVLTLAASRLLGRATATGGAAEEISISSELDLDLSTKQLGVGSTLTGKTISSATLIDGYTEEIHTISSTSPAISPTNGTIQTWTLTANSTTSAGTWAAGQSITLMVNEETSGTSYTINWSGLGVVWVGGSAPTLLPINGYTVIQLWKVGTTIYGALVGQVA